MMKITHKQLTEVLTYSPETGVFTWKTNRGRNHKIVGQRAGVLKASNGYCYIRLYGTQYLAHRLAFFYVTGENPPAFLDHINGDRADNRFCNLRPCSRSENNRNSRRRITNRSGYKGVHWHQDANKWRATIVVDRKHVSLGLFDRAKDAHAAYAAAARKLHGDFANHG